jgi:hypothetical protein
LIFSELVPGIVEESAQKKPTDASDDESDEQKYEQ